MSTDTQIIRQACLKAAASALSGSGVSADDVCEFAGELEQWVYQSDGAAEEQFNAVPAGQPNQPAVGSGTVSTGYTSCPKCGGGIFDNRPQKASGEYSAKAPDWKCRDKDGCGWKFGGAFHG